MARTQVKSYFWSISFCSHNLLGISSFEMLVFWYIKTGWLVQSCVQCSADSLYRIYFTLFLSTVTVATVAIRFIPKKILLNFHFFFFIS